MRWRTTPLFAFSFFLVSQLIGDLPRAAAQGNDLQSFDGFYTPMAAAFAADGKTLYVVNGARGDYGMIAGRGAVSKCIVSLEGDGAVKIVEQQLVKSLNAPVDIAVLARPTSVSAAGALAIAVGGSWTTDVRGKNLEDDRARGTGIVIADATSGEIVGRIFLGKGSLIEPFYGRSLMDPFSVAADPSGNIYVADFAARGTTADEPGSPQPGIWKLHASAVDALVRGNAPAAGRVEFLPVRSIPSGVDFSTRDNALYFLTGFEAYDVGGAVFRLPKGDFSGTEPLETVAKELRSLNGIGLTPKGTVLASRNSGEILIVRGRREKPVRFRDKTMFLSPGQLATTTLANGRTLVVVPEGSGGASSQWRHTVKTFTLPGGI